MSAEARLNEAKQHTIAASAALVDLGREIADLRARLQTAEQQLGQVREEVKRLREALEQVRSGLCYPDEYFKVANDALSPKLEHPECSVCRRRHGNEIQHPCE